MSSRIAKVYTNFLDLSGKKVKSDPTKTDSMKGFMSPKGQPKQKQTGNKLSQLQRVSEIVNEIKKSREV